MFQSTPEPKPGRNAIPAQRHRGAWCFNPRPSRSPGETYANIARPRRYAVSIHARAEARAKPTPAPHAPITIKVSIHARAEARAKQYYTENESGASLFQSTPEPKPGRNSKRRSQQHRHQRFNPRPSRSPGETSKRCSAASVPSCFNPRPSRSPGETGKAPH